MQALFHFLGPGYERNADFYSAVLADSFPVAIIAVLLLGGAFRYFPLHSRTKRVFFTILPVHFLIAVGLLSSAASSIGMEIPLLTPTVYGIFIFFAIPDRVMFGLVGSPAPLWAIHFFRTVWLIGLLSALWSSSKRIFPMIEKHDALWEQLFRPGLAQLRALYLRLRTR